MKRASFYSGRLKLSHPLEHPTCAFDPNMTLVDAAASIDKSGHRNAIVHDEHGSSAGVVSRQNLDQRLSQTGGDVEPNWRTRSLEMLSEARCLTRGTPSTQSAEFTDEVPCTPVFEDGRLVAVMTQDDMLVSWERMDALVRTATTDDLTGLMNRQTFSHRLNEELSRSARTGEPLSLLLIDVDSFKEINDEEGHLVGDAVLAEVATCLWRTLRRCDAVARFGGDEFVALCCSCGSRDIASPITQLLEGVRGIEVPSSQLRSVSLSIGAVCVDTSFHGLTQTELFNVADRALYTAKEAGRDAGYYSVLAGNGPAEALRIDERHSARPSVELFDRRR
jgi:diguanylate cyclase (GGDEF)-like protein